MVEERITDGRRIAQLLASELDGRTDGAFAAVAVVDADPEVDPTADGARAYDVVRETEAGEQRLAGVFVQPERVRIEFVADPERAAELASESDLRVRPKAVEPPRTLVFVEYGAAVKRAADAFEVLAAE